MAKTNRDGHVFGHKVQIEVLALDKFGLLLHRGAGLGLDGLKHVHPARMQRPFKGTIAFGVANGLSVAVGR